MPFAYWTLCQRQPLYGGEYRGRGGCPAQPAQLPMQCPCHIRVNARLRPLHGDMAVCVSVISGAHWVGTSAEGGSQSSDAGRVSLGAGIHAACTITQPLLTPPRAISCFCLKAEKLWV